MPTTTRTIAIPQQLDPVTVLGPVDEVLREVERAFPDPSELEARAFINAIINDTEVSTKPEQALVVTQILEGIYESAKQGKPFYFE